MARAITGDELLMLRADGQKSSLALIFPKPNTVYTARVNQASFTDPVTQITFDTGSGTLGNVKEGMTLWVGSAAGAYDKGRVRIRKAPSATVFYISEDSGVIWADNLYLTVVDEIDLWPRHLKVIGSTAYMDYDLAYTDQHQYPAPVPVLGPAAVVKLTGDDVTHQRDASGSWVIGGSISSYLWTATGPAAVDIDNSAAADPVFTFDTAGRYLIGCTVTSGSAKTKTGYRVTYVDNGVNRANDFQLRNCQGDVEDGGWSFTVRMFDDAEIGSVVDRAMVMLIAEDTYASTQGSIGPLAGFENVICVGHIDGESISRDPNNTGEVEFTVRGPQHWLKQIPGFPVGIENTSSTPTAWTNFQDLTVDKGLWHLLNWRSTATACMDIPSLTGDTKKLPSAEAPGAMPLWDQLVTIAQETIMAKPLCDRYGRLYIETETQVVPSASRSGFPTVQTVTDADWFDLLQIERQPYRNLSQVELSGVYYNGTTAAPLISKAQGKVYTLYGRVESVGNLLLASQAQLNTLSGDYFAWKNNELPAVDLRLMQNNRFIDITPRQYVVLNMSSAQNAREITWTSKKFIPRRVEYEHEPAAGVLTTILELEAETIGAAGGQTIPYVPPPKYGTLPIDILPNIIIPSIGPIGPYFPPIIYPPGPIPDDDEEYCPTDAPANGPFRVIGGYTLYGNSSYKISGSISAALRTSGHDNPTYYKIKARFQKYDSGWTDENTSTWYKIYAYNGSELVATGAHDAITGDGYERTGALVAATVSPITHIVLVVDGDMVNISGTYIHFDISAGSLTEGSQYVYQFGSGYVFNAAQWQGQNTMGYDIRGYGYWNNYQSLYAGRTYTVYHTLIAQCTSPEIRWIAGGEWWGGISWSHKVEEQYDEGQIAAVSKYWTYTNLGTRLPFAYIRAGKAFTNTTTTFTSIWEIYLNSQYRILLESVDLYNLCPVSS